MEMRDTGIRPLFSGHRETHLIVDDRPTCARPSFKNEVLMRTNSTTASGRAFADKLWVDLAPPGQRHHICRIRPFRLAMFGLALVTMIALAGLLAYRLPVPQSDAGATSVSQVPSFEDGQFTRAGVEGAAVLDDTAPSLPNLNDPAWPAEYESQAHARFALGLVVFLITIELLLFGFALLQSKDPHALGGAIDDRQPSVP